MQQATALVVNASGYVFSESASLTDRQHAHVVFKVPPDRFDRVVLALGRIATLVQRRIGTLDVTGQVVDLGARLAAAQTSAERLRQLLANSASVPDLLSVEGQLTAREGQADSLSGELAALRAQVDMATVTIDVSPLPTHRTAEPTTRGPGFRRGLHTAATGSRTRHGSSRPGSGSRCRSPRSPSWPSRVGESRGTPRPRPPPRDTEPAHRIRPPDRFQSPPTAADAFPTERRTAAWEAEQWTGATSVWRGRCRSTPP